MQKGIYLICYLEIYCLSLGAQVGSIMGPYNETFVMPKSFLNDYLLMLFRILQGMERIPPPPGVKTDQLSHGFFVINDTKFLDIVMQTAVGVVFCKVLCALLRNLFGC